MKTISKAAMAAILCTCVATPASAVTVTDYNGNLGSFSFSVSGNDITIDEVWDNATPVFLLFSGLTVGVDYTVTKNVRNNTAVQFTSMANELLDPSGDANDSLDPNPQPGFVPMGFSTSNDSDGLSFAQGAGIPRVSSVFGTVVVDELTDSRDFLDFINGVAAPGSLFSVSFGLTAGTGNQPFLLAQRFNTRSIDVPEPATWAMLIAGFGLVGGAMRKRTTKVVYA